MNRFIRLFMLATVSLVPAVADAATIVTATWTGIVRDGFDSDGNFGSVNADLTGSAFSLVFRYVLDEMVDASFPFDGYSSLYYNGIDNRSPSSSVSLTIKGATYRAYGTDSAAFSRGISPASRFSPATTDITYVINETDGDQFVAQFTSTNQIFGTLDLGEKFSYAITDADRASQRWSIASRATSEGLLSLDPYTLSQTIRDTSVAAVPEPATWAMMLVGFGAVGYASRRRNRVARVVAA
jgi:hypothetical protein